ncbi:MULTISPECIES: L-2-hydroxyglutarate oxidase [unclassified Francisella]|uniref:L-2-hydroxyglutarate oxidase n=1 Tax=unclassified Francisella TaxID=2610885 RepID=UPI002E374680|nr:MULTISPECIES: L-2-hydroxyglutarate oxidase [unclassified Francisella]MED7818359.1 L-2-hydroxyglutarate oxidase [Francisella sp. 19S2-4]MED7829195.1 L-2-hydroxyglutarate oxidase [Francisella sp. 19S2-10]
MRNNYDVVIIGAGIIGLSTAWQLLKNHPSLKVCILEKEGSLAKHQSGHNSGVIHAGVYYTPGSLKAKLCLEGCKEAKKFCEEYGVEYKETGKLIVALNAQESGWMENLILRCQENGLSIQRLDQDEVSIIQPGLKSEGGFLVKETGIVNWKDVCVKYAELFQNLGGEIFYNQVIEDIKESTEGVDIFIKNKTAISAKHLISCAGLHSDRILKMSGITPDYKIIPFRGEYYRLDSELKDTIKYCIYPVPNPNLPFLGVHFTPQVNQDVTIGPSAVLALAREGYKWRNINIKDCVETIFYKAFWKLVSANLKATYDELKDSMFKKSYLKKVQQYFPNIQAKDLKPYPAGVRAQALGKDGKLVDDFLFKTTYRSLHVCNAPSPAATSSLPIGKYIVNKFEKEFL